MPMIVLLVLCWIAIAIAAITQVTWAVVGWRVRRAVDSGLSVRQHIDDEIDEDLVTIVVPRCHLPT